MNRFNLLPSVNWNVSHMITLNENGTACAYGSRGDIVILKNVNKDHVNEYESKFIPRAHKSHRVTGLMFIKVLIEDQPTELLASCGDDGRIKLWNPETCENTHKCLLKKAGAPMKLVDIDFCSQNESIVSAGSETGGNVVKWDTQLNKIWTYNVDPKIMINCIAVCPHAEDLIAIGAHYGLMFIYNLKGEGKLVHRIRCHDNVVSAVSWCPVPYNALQLSNLREKEGFNEEEYKKTDKTYLLASCSCSKDRSIFICKAGLNGYCEAVLTLPAKPLTKNTVQNNIERGRYMKWIYPSVLLTSTDFNEMVTIYMSPKSEQKTDTRQKVKLSSVKFESKPLHNIHKKNISNFAVHLYDREEVDFQVWSCSADRLLVRSGYRVNYKEKPITLPLLSGYIFSLDISPTNPDLLAIGIGDGKICIWNLSTDSYVDVTTLSRKIENKVMSLRWHPHYEGILAFGTYEGRVGIFDLSQGRTIPTLFKLYHSKPIYKLCWAPPVSTGNASEIMLKNGTSKELYLFAVGNGDILQYNPSNYNEVAVSLNPEVLSCIEDTCNYKHKSDMCYDPEKNIVAVGLSNGVVCLCNAETYKLLHVITEQPKSIMALAWHPKAVMDYPNEVSPCANWLATAGESVFVYDVDPTGNEPPKKVASLEVHTHRILSLAWNPHMNGRLLSCSYDNTVIIWDAINQTILGRYVEHYAQVLCGLWSSLNKDVAITGSADFTCRMWNVSRDTITTINEVKKKPIKVIEPVIVNSSVSRDSTLNLSADSSLSTSFTKNSSSKNSTLFPSVVQGFLGSAELENTFEAAISKHNLDDLINEEDEDKTVDTTSEMSNLEELDITSEIGDKADSVSDLGDTPNVKKDKQKITYTNLFGTDDELSNLILHEERILTDSGNIGDALVLSQSRYDLKNKITDAIKNNKVTEQLLALAPSVSPKLWKEACQVYVEQMVQSDNIFQAINYQLALGKDEEAINLLCEKNRFKEAFMLARTRIKDETAVRNVLEKWIHYCYMCGLYRLGAHCYMYLKEEQNASGFLTKSRLMKDTILAITLLKYYQPKRAVELGTECFKKHLAQMSPSDVESLLKEFPEIRFMEPWYLVMKYFNEEKPNTAAVTKWLLGMLNSTFEFSSSKHCCDFEKLQNVIVDNNFSMNYEQLIIYVSAQVSLYLTGISHLRYEIPALRCYIRALFYCYNYRMINSKKVQSDAAYPMMRLLKLMFPAGIWEVYNEDVESDGTFKLLYKSIKAYYCDFVVSWLINCDDLPKSLKLLEKKEDTADMAKVNLAVLNDEEYIGDCFDVIKDKNTKLKKLLKLFSLYLCDVLDKDTVSYFKNTSKLKELDTGTVIKEENIIGEIVADNVGIKTESSSISESCNGNVHENGVSPNNDANNGPELEIKNGQNKLTVSNGKKEFSNVNNITENIKELSLVVPPENVKSPGNKNISIRRGLKEDIESFEEKRVSAPNPFYFYYMVDEYLQKNEEHNVELIDKIRKMLVSYSTKSGLISGDNQ